MTREEAIKMLKYNSNVIHRTINEETDPRKVEALDMAIKALEQEPILDFIKDCKNKIESYGKDYMFTQEEVLNIIERYAIKYTKSFKWQESEG